MIIQFCGLSGSGKSTLANRAKVLLETLGHKCEVLDGDVYRKKLCADLDFSKAGRNENIRRLGFVADVLSRNGVIAIICAINPYDNLRQELETEYRDVKTVYISCPIDVLVQRDTKQLYHRAMLPAGHPDKINNLTGVNDPFEIPPAPHLIIDTAAETEEASAQKLLGFILAHK